jgi:hypothetical protein
MNEQTLATLLSHPFGQVALIVVISAIVSFLAVRMMTSRPSPASAPARTAPAAALAASPGPDAGLIAAISAAVYSAIGAHQIVYIGDSHQGVVWTSEARAHHHASHVVPRVHHSND